MRLAFRSALRAPLVAGGLSAAWLATPALLIAWQDAVPPVAEKRAVQQVVPASATGEPTPAPRVLSPPAAQPISRDAAQLSEPATVVIEDSSPPEPGESARSPLRLKSATDSGGRTGAPEPTIEAAMLKSIQPGTSTMAQVRTAWGEPERVDRYPQHVEHKHKLEPFQQVIVAYRGDTVATIVVHLQAPLASDMVRGQIGLEDLQPALVYDPSGKLLGQAFPERGVLFSLQPGAKEPLVTQIVLEGIHPEPFAMRAESRLATHWLQGLKDVEQALRLEPRFARAHWLKAQLLAAAGRTSEAIPGAEEAVRLEASNAEYRLTRARLYHARGETARAISETKAAVAQAAAPLVKARALNQLADLVAAGRNHQEAVQHRQEALDLLESLMASGGSPAAREALLEAHLGTAHDIAWGRWNRKGDVVSRWLEEARTIAQEDHPAPGVARQRQLRLGRGALGALAGLPGELDPTSWIDSLEATTLEALAATSDSLCRAQLHWELGLACYDAMQAYHARGDSQGALRVGTKGIEELTQAAALGRSGAEHDYLLGRLYFRTGAVHAVLKGNHAQAVAWYERALPLVSERPATAGGDAGKQGESLVSMAVSYWDVGQRDKALELTSQGLSQMQQAVQQGLLDETALSVPYNNLAQMHRRLGDMQAAGRFAQMASRSQGAMK